MKRNRVIIASVVVVILGLLAAAFLRPREPRYQGRTLTQWIETVKRFTPVLDDPPADPDWQAASRAVKSMAPAAIPILLKWASSEDSPMAISIKSWLNKHVRLNKHAKLKLNISPGAPFISKAAAGFALLGTNGSAAWPTLIQWTSSKNICRSGDALYCLAASRPPEEIIKPVLLRLVGRPDQNIRADASLLLHLNYPKDAEAAGVYTNFGYFRNWKTNADKQPGQASR